MRVRALLLLSAGIFFAPALHARIGTVGIRGSVFVAAEVYALNGDFTYTLLNKTDSPQNRWTVVVHPLVDILTVRANGADVPVLSQYGAGYRILSITLPLKAQERASVTIRFSLLPQKDDPRFTLDARGAFLDGRRLWFPAPLEEEPVNYEINVTAPKNLRVLMAGRMVSENTLANSSLWANEVGALPLSGTLILTEKPRNGGEGLYYYGEERDLDLTHFLPYWKAIREKNNFFPLSELHILPIDLKIPGKGDEFADGEFIGNILLIDGKLAAAASANPSGDFFLAGPAQKRLTETMIHELFHAYLPGVLRYRPEESLIMESFVQYLSWNLISTLDPAWAEELSRRNRFLMLNLLTARDTQNPIWKYLLGSALFAATFEQSSLKGLALINTLSEKYRYTPFTLQDVIETADIHQNLMPGERVHSEFLGEFQRTFLYNTALQSVAANINGASPFGDSKEEPVTFLRVLHTYPREWQGTFSWAHDGKTNNAALAIASNSIWVTNFTKTVSHAVLKSPFDNLEQFMGDNLLPRDDLGWKLVQHLNHPDFFEEGYRRRAKILIAPALLEKLKLYRDLQFTYLWDNSWKSEVQAYLVDSRNIRQAFISINVLFSENLEITGIFNPLERRILNRRKQQAAEE